MPAQVTLTVSDEVLQRAEALARIEGKNIPDFLSHTIETSLQPLGSIHEREREIAGLSDADLLKVREARMPEDLNRRFSELQHRQQAGLLTEDERGELSKLLQECMEGTLAKALAAEEAARRGLRKS